MSKPRLLLIDDEVALLEALTRYFSALGYVVYQAPSGEKGVELFGRVRPHVTVLDVMMPGMSGLDVLNLLRERNAAVVMLTGVDTADLAAEAFRLGAADFLVKPVDMPLLAAAVRAAAGRPRSGRRSNRG